jgi:GLEYA domain
MSEVSENEYTLKDTTLYTHNRLNDYLTHYTDYVSKMVGTGKNQVEVYKYYHFDYSPNGIQKTNIGRIPSGLLTGENPNPNGMDPTYPEPIPSVYPPAINSWVKYNTTQTDSSTTTSYNSTDGWFMELAKKYSKTKMDEIKNNYPNLALLAGLSYKLITDFSYSTIGITGRVSNPNPYSQNPKYYITKFSNPETTIKTSGRCATTMDNFNNSLNIANADTTYANTVVGIEWFGYFKPATLGLYSFSLNVGQGYAAIWFDNDALFDYTDKNAYFTGPSKLPLTVQITEPKYYPIRIQYFADSVANLTSGQRVFNLTTLDKQSNNNLVASDVFYTINNNTYLPPLLYCAFVSESPETHLLNKFECYICDTSNKTSSPSQFLSIIDKTKFDVIKNKYDVDRGTPNQKNYLTLPDGTFFTEVFIASVSKYPSAFSVYRIDVDPRMGNTYQIDVRGTGPYKINPISPQLLIPSKSYEQIDNYYVDPKLAIQMNPESCKTQCNNSNKCNYYFTYTANGVDQCVLDSTNSIPNFSQIRPSGTTLQSNVDAGTSTLFMRNFEIHPPPCEITGPISVQSIINTSTYSSAFPYAQYDLNSTPITDLSFVGVCGDSSYKKISQDAYDILFKNTMYNTDGKWKNQNGDWTNTEGFTPSPTKFTNALSDTHDLASTELENAKTYATLQKQINQNYNLLGTKEIPEYLKTRDFMSNDVKYDYNGNVLLYYRNKPIPGIQEQNVMDAKEGYQMQNSLYILGTLTAATLLVLAIIIARE